MSAADELSPKSGNRSPRVFPLTIVVSPDPSSSAPSNSSAVKTPDPQSSGPSVSLIETEGLYKTQRGDPESPEPAAEGDIQMGCPSD
jgi:hypothetical protein